MGSGYHIDKDRFQTVLKVNIAVFIAEILAGYSSGSLSMISDSFHVSLHVFASLVAIVSEYEFLGINSEKIKFWSAVTNIALFFPLAYLIAIEAYRRWQTPPILDLTPTYFLIAFLGLVANLYTVFILPSKKDNHTNKNVWILRIHMIFDSIGSIIVIGGAFEILRTGNYFIDPVSSMILAGLIILA